MMRKIVIKVVIKGFILEGLVSMNIIILDIRLMKDTKSKSSV